MKMTVELRVQKFSDICNLEVRLNGYLLHSDATDGLWQCYKLQVEHQKSQLEIFQYYGTNPHTIDGVGPQSGKGFQRCRDVIMSKLCMDIAPHRDGEIIVYAHTKKHLYNINGKLLITQAFFEYETRNMKVLDGKCLIGWNPKQHLRYIFEQGALRALFGVCLTVLLLICTIYLVINGDEWIVKSNYNDYSIMGALLLCFSLYDNIRTILALRKAFYVKDL